MTDLIHPFTKSGLGNAPFQVICCIGLPPRALAEANPSAHNAGLRECAMSAKHFGVRLGTCYHCGTGIMNNYVIKSADGTHSVVGCDCIRKVYSWEPMLKVKLAIAEKKFKKEKKARKAKQSRREKVLAAFRDHPEILRRAWRLRKSDQFVNSILATFWQYGTLSEGQRNAIVRAEERLADFAKAKAEAEAKAAKSTHLGAPGERMEFEAKLVRRIVRDFWALSILETRDGQTLSTFGNCRVPEEFTKFKATVKEHRINPNTAARETSINRIKIG